MFKSIADFIKSLLGLNKNVNTNSSSSFSDLVSSSQLSDEDIICNKCHEVLFEPLRQQISCQQSLLRLLRKKIKKLEQKVNKNEHNIKTDENIENDKNTNQEKLIEEDDREMVQSHKHKEIERLNKIKIEEELNNINSESNLDKKSEILKHDEKPDEMPVQEPVQEGYLTRLYYGIFGRPAEQ